MSKIEIRPCCPQLFSLRPMIAMENFECGFSSCATADFGLYRVVDDGGEGQEPRLEAIKFCPFCGKKINITQVSQKVVEGFSRKASPVNGSSGRPLLYVACPYSTGIPIKGGKRLTKEQKSKIMDGRAQIASSATLDLITAGIPALSPLTHSIGLLQFVFGDKWRMHDSGWEQWKVVDEAFIASCTAVVILNIDGWEDSSGVLKEREIAKKLGKTVFLWDPLSADAIEVLVTGLLSEGIDVRERDGAEPCYLGEEEE